MASSDLDAIRPSHSPAQERLLRDDPAKCAAARPKTAGSASRCRERLALKFLIPHKDQATDRFGGADLDVPLAAQAPVGEYSILVTHESSSTRRTFRVEEYRVPTFKVAVELPDAPAGSLVTAKLSAQYLFGGALSGRAFRWQLVKEPAAFSPKGERKVQRYQEAYREAPEDAAEVKRAAHLANGTLRGVTWEDE